MSLAIDPIHITGLRELQAALRALDGESQKQLRIVFNEAADLIVKTARPNVPSVTGEARRSLKATSGQRDARVSGGSAKAPYFGWLDYGGRVGHGRTGKNTGRQFRPFEKGGRYVYPAYHARKAEITDLLDKGMADLIAAAGLEATP